MRQWVVVEMENGLVRDTILGIYGPFDNEALANAFAEAYALQMQHLLIQVFELNKELKNG